MIFGTMIMLAVPIGLIAFIFIMIIIMKEKHLSLFNLYLLLISIAGFLGTIIGYGVLINTVLDYNFINTKEYVTMTSYEVKGCEGPNYTSGGKEQTRTEAEIAKCKEDSLQEALIRRDYNYKQGIIGGGVWGTLFLLAFASHFPSFRRRQKEQQ